MTDQSDVLYERFERRFNLREGQVVKVFQLSTEEINTINYDIGVRRRWDLEDANDQVKRISGVDDAHMGISATILETRFYDVYEDGLDVLVEFHEGTGNHLWVSSCMITSNMNANQLQDIFDVVESLDALIALITTMGLNNSLRVRPVVTWPTEKFTSKLIQAANRLPPADWDTFINGEVTDVDQLNEKYDLHELDAFLNEIFDGNLHDEFYGEF